MMTNKELGEAGESYAMDVLISKGYVLVERNFRWQRAEVDLIMSDGNELVFVEVKTRNSDYFGDPLQTVTRSKQRQIIKAANAYLQENSRMEEARFDVVAIVWNQFKREAFHIRDAFYPLL